MAKAMTDLNKGLNFTSSNIGSLLGFIDMAFYVGEKLDEYERRQRYDEVKLKTLINAYRAYELNAVTKEQFLAVVNSLVD